MNGKYDAAMRLYNVYTDHMIFQRGKPARFAGSAPAGAEIHAIFESDDGSHSFSAKTRAGRDGEWFVEFPAQEAGGPWTASFESSSTPQFKIRDILFGDVWICGGQSNMEFHVRGARFYSLIEGEELAAKANDPGLRVGLVSRAVSPDGPCRDASGRFEWRRADCADAVADLSAVGYYFGLFLRKKLGNKIPIGILSCSWGGCRIEPWIDEETLRRHNAVSELESIASARKMRGRPVKRDAVTELFRKRMRALKAWLKRYEDKKAAATALASWAKPNVFERGAWTLGTLGTTGDPSLVPFVALQSPGIVWYRFEIELPEGVNAVGTRFIADSIDDTDETFWDGVKIGATGVETRNHWAAIRSYVIPGKLLKGRKHVLCIRVQNHFCVGRVAGPRIEFASGEKIDLLKAAAFERVESRPSEAIGLRPMSPWQIEEAGARENYGLPSTEFNAMLAPFTVFRYRGAIWYQGCSNASEWKVYPKFQRWLVESWRKATRSPDMTFLAVQLAGYERHSPLDRMPDDYWKKLPPPDASALAEMRTAQTEIRSIKGCELATAVDIGDHSDIHPANKKEVARRLAALAGKLTYGETGTASGPRATGAELKNGELVVSFSHVGKGLALKGGKGFGKHAFAVRAAGGKWQWTDAKLKGDKVFVSCAGAKNPVAVRYAWMNYPPNMRLFNRDGFPCEPFDLTVSKRK